MASPHASIRWSQRHPEPSKRRATRQVEAVREATTVGEWGQLGDRCRYRGKSTSGACRAKTRWVGGPIPNGMAKEPDEFSSKGAHVPPPRPANSTDRETGSLSDSSR